MWNENIAFDDLLGQARLGLTEDDGDPIKYGRREWYSLDNGKGSICCTIRQVQLTEMDGISDGQSFVVSASFPKLPKIAAR